MLERYAQAYPGLLADVDERTARRLEATLSTTRDGRLWPPREVAALVARLEGRITFEEYRALGRVDLEVNPIATPASGSTSLVDGGSDVLAVRTPAGRSR